MTAVAIAPTNEEHWKLLRTQDVTSTESSALFGHSPYATAFQLWHQKKDAVVVDFEANERMDWGNDLQDSIALSLARRYGVTVVRITDYMRIVSSRMGASFDFEIVGINLPDRGRVDGTLIEMFEKHGPGILEIKNVDRSIFYDKWLKVDEQQEGGKKFIEPPGHIDIQLQHQLHVRERAWGAIGVLVGGNTGKLVVRERDLAVGAALESKIITFWMSIANDQPPPPTFPNDASFVASLYKTTVDRIHDGRGDEGLDKALADYKEASDREKLAKEDKEVAKAKWLTIIGDAARAYSDRFNVATWPVKGSTFTVTREPYRGFRVTEKKGS